MVVFFFASNTAVGKLGVLSNWLVIGRIYHDELAKLIRLSEATTMRLDK